MYEEADKDYDGDKGVGVKFMMIMMGNLSALSSWIS